MRCSPQDLVRPLQLPVLLLQGLHPGSLVGRHARGDAFVDVGLFDPDPERLDPVAQLRGDPVNCAVLGPQLRSQ